MGAKTVCLDFDGVLHSYTHGWRGPDIIPDPPLAAGVALARALKEAGYRVVVFSTRCRNAHARALMVRWLDEHGVPYDEVSQEKPLAVAYVDDRGVPFRAISGDGAREGFYVRAALVSIEKLAARRPRRVGEALAEYEERTAGQVSDG